MWRLATRLDNAGLEEQQLRWTVIELVELTFDIASICDLAPFVFRIFLGQATIFVRDFVSRAEFKSYATSKQIL